MSTNLGHYCIVLAVEVSIILYTSKVNLKTFVMCKESMFNFTIQIFKCLNFSFS